MPRKVRSEPPDSYGEIWANVYDEEPSFLVPAEEQLDLLEHLADDRPVLELGIGTGRVALPLAARGIDVSGIDTSRSMVDRMRSKPGGADISVTIGDMADLPTLRTFGLVYVVFNTLFGLGRRRSSRLLQERGARAPAWGLLLHGMLRTGLGPLP